ncbi:MAG TPA: SufE family protein [Chitinophagales bacterium]|nr:SufE family protein [Chitinophagales bacterium]MCB0512205.1 SufE family protein [Bacteroidota bacterium]MCB9075585.1 SufE family protein [Chitinophagales bacterium]HMU97654.1 SufE family protein [Chitinophagales bacterium]HMW93874.1 SufE family protein [Chitinophagales bacterium]
MATINDIQDEIIEDFSIYEDWTDKYEYLIDFGKSLSILDEKYKTEETRINGCQSKVWLYAEKQADKVVFFADSDAIITKGIVGLLVKVLSGHTPEEIAESDLYFIDKIGLKEHLSPTRANGLVSMIKKIKTYGVAFQAIN